jgi:hypothetical protein
MLVRTDPDSHRISCLELLGAFCPLPIYIHFDAVDGVYGQPARFEEARCPEPFVEPNAGRFL